MDEKNKKSDKQLGFLDLIKERIRNKPTRSNDSQASPASSQAPSPSQEEKLPPARAIINVAPNSLLFTLWYEWKTAGSGQTGGLKAGGAIGGAGHTGEASFALEPFEIAMEPPGMPKLPISTQELEAEKRRATIQLMARARKHYQLTLPDREGNVPDVDAEMYIHVAQSRMAAWAFLFPPAGNGKPLRPAQVDMALQEYSVSAGISREALDGLIQEQPYFKLVPIAYGIPPVDGRDGAVVEKFSRAPKVDYRPDEHGNMDYRTLNNIQIVHAGDLICEELPPTPGTDGMDVLGSPIPAKAGRPARITPGRNTELSGEPGRLTASVDGHLQYANGSFQVNPLLEIRGNVDLKVGNIDFLGDVHISIYREMCLTISSSTPQAPSSWTAWWREPPSRPEEIFSSPRGFWAMKRPSLRREAALKPAISRIVWFTRRKPWKPTASFPPPSRVTEGSASAPAEEPL